MVGDGLSCMSNADAIESHTVLTTIHTCRNDTQKKRWTINYGLGYEKSLELISLFMGQV